MYKSFSFLRVTAFSLFTILPLGISAGPVSETAALQKAQAFLKERNPFDVPTLQSATLCTTSHTRRVKSSVSDESSLYVFNVGTNDGFVIVSGDDRTPAILGYADSGSISDNNMPDGLRWLLEGYEEEIAVLNTITDNVAHPAQAPRKAPARHTIEPLIKTYWDQGAPYNKGCPDVDDVRTVTGCVATSMAQLMNYHQWPKVATPIPAYTTNTCSISRPELSSTVFSWDLMTATYSSSDTGDAANAVAELMTYCGQSLHMDYNKKISNAFGVCIAEALKTYFGYDSSTRFVQRQHYSYLEWVDLIYSELAERRPVELGGQSTGGGHSFICDGYQDGDYFHINWGWGGSSDGYYRLSALNPYDQGIGGSSTLDGFSFSQDAIIGIRPSSSGTPAKDCLSLEYFQLNFTDSYSTKTITRSNASDAFTGIELYFAVCKYTYKEIPFDYAVQFTDANGEVLSTISSWKEVTMKFNTDIIHTLNSVSTPVGLADGTYYINVVSRANGEEEWQECYDGMQQRITAIISGNTMTLTAPFVRASDNLPTGVTFTITGNQTVYYEQKVTASITGGNSDYHGNVVLRVNNKGVMGKVLDIPAGQTVDAIFTFTPTESGSTTLSLYNAKSGGNKIGSSKTITIAASDATDNLDLSFSGEIHNLIEGNKLYGHALRATVTVGNTSTTNSYSGGLYCYVFEWEPTGEQGHYSGHSIKGITYPMVLEKASSESNPSEKEFDIAFDGLETLENGHLYSLRCYYLKNGDTTFGKDLGWSIGGLNTIGGYSLGNADGTTNVYPVSNTINAGNACYVDMTDMGDTDLITVTPSSNPNCLYLLPSNAAIPSGLSGYNIVCGNTAGLITLVDDKDNEGKYYEFFSPIDFTATSITYTRTINRAATTTGGWSTMMLPFTVSEVTCDGKTVDWFHSEADTQKNFWLKTMTGDEGETAYFDFTDEMKANTPYIIAVPGEDFGAELQMTGKPITFTGSGLISASATSSMSGNLFKYCGSTVSTTLKDVYMLNTAGNKFIKATKETTLPPFRAWIAPVSITSLSKPSLAIGNGEIQGIIDLQIANVRPNNSNTYNLGGQKIVNCNLKPGLYIRNGKKIIIR